MTNIKFKYTTDVIEKEKNFRFYRYSKHSILNLFIDKKRLFLYANVNQEFLDLHSIKTSRVLIPIVNSFKYHNSKIYVLEVEIFNKTKTAGIKKSLINLIDELVNSFQIAKDDTQGLYRLIIKYTNFNKIQDLEAYLEDKRIAS